MIPTAREALERAVAYIDDGQLEIARFWLDVAKELREDWAMRRVWGETQSASKVVYTPPSRDPRGRMTDSVVARQTDTQKIQVPVPRPGEAIEGDGQRCRHCGYFLKNVTPPDSAQTFYVHTRTGRQMCPVTGERRPDDTWVHTFAEPE